MTVKRGKARSSNGASPPADWKKLIEEWVWNKFGRGGIVVLAIVLVLGMVWWKWDEIVKLPGIAELAKLAGRERLPQGDPRRVSIAVAHLEGDANDELQQILLAGLSNYVNADQGPGGPSLQILHFDRTIEMKGGDLELEESNGHEAARRLLAESNSDFLLWGRVLRQGNQTRPRLFWTSARKAARGKTGDVYAMQGFELPPVFWTDLNHWLGLLLETQAAELDKLSGRYAVERLTPFIERTRKLLNSQARSWDADTRSKIRILFADALRVYGEQRGISQPLEEASAALQDALNERARDRVPLDWAATQHNLGNVLFALGNQGADAARLKAAVAAYHEALKERTRERAPLDWALTQFGLGNALVALGPVEIGLGQLEAGIGHLKEGKTAYQESIKERTRERVPLDWAASQTGLGTGVYMLGDVLEQLGKREDSAVQLKQAEGAFQEALKELTRERVPLDWAVAQIGLGNARFLLGQQEESGTVQLKAAEGAYQEALKELTRERMPHEWAVAEFGLGNALSSLGKREASTARLEAAVAAYQSALQVWHGANMYANMAQQNLQSAQIALDNLRAKNR